MSSNQYYGSQGGQYPPPNQQQAGSNISTSNNQQYPPQQGGYSAPSGPPHSGYSAPSGPPHSGYSAPTGAPPGYQAPRRADTDAGLPQGQERSEQMEHLQAFEANARKTEDDVNQETLQKEFPTIDSSLIAAIYGDSGSLSATREMLQELSSTTN